MDSPCQQVACMQRFTKAIRTHAKTLDFVPHKIIRIMLDVMTITFPLKYNFKQLNHVQNT